MKPLSILFVTLAPLLSIVDAVDGAPAVGMGPAVHRRAVGNLAHGPWHKRQSGNGPPSVITVGGSSTTDTTTTTTTATTTATDSNTGASSAASTGTDTTNPNATTGTDAGTTTAPTTTAGTSTDSGSFLSSLLSGLLPSGSTTTTDPGTTDPGTTNPATTDPGTTAAPTTTDPGTTTSPPTSTDTGILDPLTSLVGGVTSIVSNVTSDLGGVTSGLPTTTDTSTDPPLTTSDTSTDPPPTTTSTPTTTDTGNGNGGTTITTATTTTSSPALNITDVFPTTTDSQSITTTITDSVTPTTLSINSDYQFITASSFLIAPTSTTSLDVTNTDPDAVQTSAVVAGTGTTLTAASIPTSIPMFITPPASSDPTAPGTSIPGYTEISILFKTTANWVWVLTSSETAAQILAYMGPLIATSLNITGDEVKTVGLQAFVPNDYTQESDLQTLWLGQIPTDLVPTLSALIHTPNSKFYNTGDDTANSIASNVVMSFNIATVAGVNSSNGASTQSSSGTSSTNHSQRNAIIGVSVAFGVVVLVVTAWWLTKTYKERQEGAHKRLSYRGNTNYGSTTATGNTAAFAAGAGGVTYGGYDRQSRGGETAFRADSPPMLHNPFLTDQEREEQARGIRRNSFYAIGPDDESIEEETFDYLSQRNSAISGGGAHGAHGTYGVSGGAAGLNRAGSGGSGGRGGNVTWAPGTRGVGQGGPVRRPVIGQPISAPILRESSMGNW